MSQVISQFTLLYPPAPFYLSRIRLSALSDSTWYLTTFDRAALAVSRREQANIKRGFLSSGILRCVSR